MALVTSDLVKLVLAGVKTDFQAAYQRKAQAAVYRQIATVVPTTLPTQDYGWLSSNPTMREMVSERQIKALREYNSTISDKEWEASIGVKRKAFEDEQYGLIRMRASQLSDEPLRHRHQMVVEKLALSHTLLGPDGVYFIGATHAESGSNQSNYVTDALSEGAVATGISAMMLFTDDNAVPMGVIPNLLVVGPKNQWIADRICNSATLITTGQITATSSPTVQGDRNALQGKLSPLVTPYLQGTYDDYWFLLDTTRGMGAVILQERSDIVDEFTGVTDPSDSYVFLNGEFLWGVRGRYNVGYGLWQTAYGGIL